MARKPTDDDLTCWRCGEVLPTRLAWSIHVSLCRVDAGPITRPVHCPACATPIDLRKSAVCSGCGRTYER
jgi:hypothetical protein